MKNTLVFLLTLCFLYSCTKKNEPTYNEIKAGFEQIPDSIQTSVYWYWISDHISADGVVKDLHAMKAAGINRAFIGNIGLDDDGSKAGKVKFASDEWWSILHTALKTATELDIEIGIFNSPGWSQSGGPWIKANEAMRYLASVKQNVSGGKKLEVQLEKPSSDFEDVKVIAFPDKSKQFPSYRFDIPREGADTFDFAIDKEFTLRSLKVFLSGTPVNGEAILQAKVDGRYETVAQFRIDRYNSNPNVGFDPYAPIVISVPEVKSSEFLLVLRNASGAQLEALELSEGLAIERYAEKSLAKMFQQPLPYWDEYQWEEQPLAADGMAVRVDEVLDITSCLQGNTLVWDAPEGDWVVQRVGMLPTGVTNSPASREATGLEVDKMSRRHVEQHFDSYMGEITRRIPAEDRKTWKVVVQDSYETGGQNFTDEMLSDFKSEYGYDLVPFLPVFDGVVVQSPDASDRVLWDVRRFVADRIATEYVAGLRDVAHKNGLTTWLENYGHWGFPGEFLKYGGMSDEIGGEFWAEGDLGNIENRAASSCGHIYGKTKISAESFTSAGNPFGRHPAMLKQRGDRFFSEGINNTLLHVYVHQPYEKPDHGLTAWFGTEFNRMNVWYSHLDLFTKYLKRVNFMLQQGLNVADVAYFIGEDAPKMTGLEYPALPQGYQFDYINADVLVNRAEVKDGLITLPHGTQYRILVLPPQETMRPEVLRKIKQLVENGAVVLGNPPRRSPSYQNYGSSDAEIQELSTQLWGNVDGKTRVSREVGKGLILRGIELADALTVIGCPPDCQIKANEPLLYGHRKAGDTDIYFITNQSDSTVVSIPLFRVQGKMPELWCPVSGEVRDLPLFVQHESGISAPICLEANQSIFVVFDRPIDRESMSSFEEGYPDAKPIVNLGAGWKVQFDSARDATLGTVDMPALFDLAKHDDVRIRTYSGNMIYKNTFTLNEMPSGNTFVSFGQVGVMAKVYINGKYAGGAWTPPYRVDITSWIKEGKNTIEVDVVNTWVNRLAADGVIPTPSAPPASGIIGPVTVENINY